MPEHYFEGFEAGSLPAEPEARGTVRIRGEMVNQDGVTVMTMTSRGHVGRRLPG